MAFKTVVEAVRSVDLHPHLSGKDVKGTVLHRMRVPVAVRFGRLVRMHANDREDIDLAEAGDIVAVVGVDCASGTRSAAEGMNLSLESIFVRRNAVIRLSIEPMKRDDADKLAKLWNASAAKIRRSGLHRRRNRPDTDRRDGTVAPGNLRGAHQARIQGVSASSASLAWLTANIRPRRWKYNYKHKKQTGGSGQYAHIVGRAGTAAGRIPKNLRVRE
jgi:elongation factor G